MEHAKDLQLHNIELLDVSPLNAAKLSGKDQQTRTKYFSF